MRPSIRFEVFKRDGFTCAYCNRKPPETTLEVDHIIPLAEGATDDFENLVTACWDCNRGKGAAMLDDRAPVPDLETRTADLLEREAQLRAYHEAKAEQARRRDAQLTPVWNHWFDVFGEKELSRWYTPHQSSLRKYIDALGCEEVIEAIDITAAKFSYRVSNDAVRYLMGVLRGKLAKEEGRVVSCHYCKKAITLDPGEDPTATWWHTVCKEKAEAG